VREDGEFPTIPMISAPWWILPRVRATFGVEKDPCYDTFHESDTTRKCLCGY
jgi:hypothetical protein